MGPTVSHFGVRSSESTEAWNVSWAHVPLSTN